MEEIWKISKKNQKNSENSGNMKKKNREIFIKSWKILKKFGKLKKKHFQKIKKKSEIICNLKKRSGNVQKIQVILRKSWKIFQKI